MSLQWFIINEVEDMTPFLNESGMAFVNYCESFCFGSETWLSKDLMVTILGNIDISDIKSIPQVAPIIQDGRVLATFCRQGLATIHQCRERGNHFKVCQWQFAKGFSMGV